MEITHLQKNVKYNSSILRKFHGTFTEFSYLSDIIFSMVTINMDWCIFLNFTRSKGALPLLWRKQESGFVTGGVCCHSVKDAESRRPSDGTSFAGWNRFGCRGFLHHVFCSV